MYWRYQWERGNIKYRKTGMYGHSLEENAFPDTQPELSMCKQNTFKAIILFSKLIYLFYQYFTKHNLWSSRHPAFAMAIWWSSTYCSNHLQQHNCYLSTVIIHQYTPISASSHQNTLQNIQSEWVTVTALY